MSCVLCICVTEAQHSSGDLILDSQAGERRRSHWSTRNRSIQGEESRGEESLDLTLDKDLTPCKEIVVSFSKCQYHVVPLTSLSATVLHDNYINYKKNLFLPLWAAWLFHEGYHPSLWGSPEHKNPCNYPPRHSINRVFYKHNDWYLIGFIHGSLPVPLKLLLHCIPRKKRTSFNFCGPRQWNNKQWERWSIFSICLTIKYY